MGAYYIPGIDIVYSFILTNIGTEQIEADTIFLVDTIPDEITFYNDDIDIAGYPGEPVVSDDNGPGLTLTYASDVGYSQTLPANFVACNYSPALGYDENVKFICLNPKGQMAFGDPDPSFEIKFRAKIN